MHPEKTAEPVTSVYQDKLADLPAVDDHAQKLVGAKAQRDLARFLHLTERPLSIKETIAAALGALLVAAMLAALAMAFGT